MGEGLAGRAHFASDLWRGEGKGPIFCVMDDAEPLDICDMEEPMDDVEEPMDPDLAIQMQEATRDFLQVSPTSTLTQARSVGISK